MTVHMCWQINGLEAAQADPKLALELLCNPGMPLFGSFACALLFSYILHMHMRRGCEAPLDGRAPGA